MVRVRYPRDPFTEEPELAWWCSHPAVQVLYRLPEEQRERLQGALLETGDLTLLTGHLMVLPESDKQKFADAAQNIERNKREIVENLEEHFKDSEHLAYVGEAMQPGW
jgi:hypothetical protein